MQAPARDGRRPLWLALIASGLIALVCIVTAAVVRAVYDDRVLPGTRVAGVRLDGASREDARRRLRAVVGSNVPLTVVAAGRRVRVRPSTAGYAGDLDRTVDRALAAGRSGAVSTTWSALAGFFGRTDVPVAGTVDAQRLRRTAGRLARRLDRRGSPGALRIDPTTLDVDTSPPRAGVDVHRPRLARRLRDALLRRDTRVIRLEHAVRPVPSRRDVEAVGRAAAAYLEAPLRLSGPGPSLTVARRQLASILMLRATQDGRSAALGTRRARVSALVRRLAERYDRPGRSASISAPARSIIVDGKGDVSWAPRRAKVRVGKARPGRRLRRPDVAAATDEAVRTGRHRAPLSAARVAPAITGQDARRVRSLIGTFTTRYEPGQPRVTNIRRIARAVDGTVIPAGGQFSLNRVAGPRTRAKGYVEAPFIADGRLVPSVGGGVSQFSTTMFNAAFFAGLQLDGHQPHSLFIDRYPAGREATLNFPDIDLRWTNDTRAPVLVRTATDASSVTVSLYGANGGRRVRAQTGAREPVEGGDFSIQVTRVVRYADGRTVRRAYTTIYDRPADPS